MSVAGTVKRIIPAPVKKILRSVLGPSTIPTPVSTGYEPISKGDLARTKAELDGAWRDPGIPTTQLELVDRELGRLGRGERVPVYEVFLSLLGRIPGIESKSLLEVGCASGYYGDVLRSRGWNTTYAGCDFSSAFVTLARKRLPGVEFEVQDATHLDYADASRDVVVSGCCILHIVDYPAAIREAARVAREYVLFHRTPVLHVADTTFYRKKAYGVDCIEIHFNESELFRLFAAAGLQVQEVETVAVGAVAPPGDAMVVKSYLCRVA